MLVSQLVYCSHECPVYKENEQVTEVAIFPYNGETDPAEMTAVAAQEGFVTPDQIEGLRVGYGRKECWNPEYNRVNGRPGKCFTLPGPISGLERREYSPPITPFF